MIWMQRWIDVLFLHAPVSPAELERFLPRSLEVETFNGQAWISNVLFRLKLRPLGLPYVPGLSSLVELNLRTYVRHRNQSGIYFLRMYANNRLSVAAARWLTPLDYRLGRLLHKELPDGRWRAACESEADSFHVGLCCQPIGTPALLRPGSLDEWLLERYRLYVGGKDQMLFAADVEHPPWEAVRMEEDVMGSGQITAGETLAPRLLHYSPGVAATFREFRVVGAATEGRVAAQKGMEETISGTNRTGGTPILRNQPAHAAGRRGGR